MQRTYGRLFLTTGSKDRGWWHLDAEPHIMLRAKRVFERLKKTPGQSASLSDSPENCRDLLWFLDRYPLDITEEHRRRLKRGARQFDERILTLESIIGGKHEPRTFDMALPPREYQRLAADVYLKNGSLLLADDVGLGKTCSAIATFTDKRTLPAVVVTLAGALPAQWKREIERFIPGLFVHVLKSGRPYPLPMRHKTHGDKPDVVVLNYHKLHGWADVLRKYAKSVVWDEAQELRRSDSDKYAAAKAIATAADFRLGLTATPIYNYGSEMFNVVECTSPGALGTKEEFSREWCKGDTDDTARIHDPRAFGSYLRENFIMLRRTRAEVGRELPGLTRISHTIDSDRAALDRIEGTARDLARIILSATETHRGEKMHAAEELSNMVRQATGIAKAPYVADFVRMIIESGEPVVLYGWHRAVYEIWKEKLADFKPAWYTGAESSSLKAKEVARFTGGETPLIILSLRAGAGIDGLQHRSATVVKGELDWSPGVHEQCTGRVFRDGQSKPVFAYYLVAEDGSDPLVAERLGLKREQVEGIRNPNADLLEELEDSGDRIKELAVRFLKRGAA